MTETTTRLRGRGGRRAAALAGAIGLVFAGALMAGPAVAAAADPARPVPISEELVTDVAPEIGPVVDEGIVPISEEAGIEPTDEIAAVLTRPAGLSVFLASALTLGAGGIAIARVAAQRRQSTPAASSE